VPGVTLAGIHSRTRATAEKVAAEYGIALVCDSVEELYDRTRADLVVMTVSELSTNAVAKACFEHPWTVLTEKPAGYCLSDAEDIAAAARKRGRNVYVALNRRFLGSTRRAKAELDADGTQRFIKVQDQEDPVAGRKGGKPEKVVESWMFANAIHTIDYLRVFGRGRVRKVQPIIAWNPSAPGVVVARIDFESGDVGLYEGIWHGPGPWAISVTVPGRRWEMRPLEQLETQRLGERPVKADPDPLDLAFKPGFRLQAENAVGAALGRPSKAVTIEDALDTMRLIDAIFRAP
jgi:predicted dehydrogenase